MVWMGVSILYSVIYYAFFVYNLYSVLVIVYSLAHLHSLFFNLLSIHYSLFLNRLSFILYGIMLTAFRPPVRPLELCFFFFSFSLGIVLKAVVVLFAHEIVVSWLL